MKETDLIQEQVKAHLKKKRYIHTIGVVNLAVKLAECYGENKTHAKVAALLHDYCKYISNEEMIKSLLDLNFEVNNVLFKNPNLGHGFLASIVVQSEFGVEDLDIINAIANHTFGRRGMSRLEKIIYLADSLEENRDYDGIDGLRSLAFKDLDRALLKSCENTLAYELNRGNLIHPNTIEMRNELLYNS